jgi:hypothetical protein
MLPTKSNTAEQGCSPVSSNCVIWQGPALPCINLCNGDTVSDVVYKVAQDLCTIKDELDLSDLDLTCLVSFCSSTNPAPTTKTLSAVLEFIIKKVCCLSTTVGGINPGNSYTEPTLSLPACLQYVDPGTGLTVTQLIHNQFTLRLANQHCSLKATVDQHTTQISTINTTLASHQTQINNLQTSQIPNVTPNCVLPAVPTAVTTVVDALEEQYCLLRSQVGATNQVTAAIAQQCSNLAALPALSQTGNMNALVGWNNTLTNLSQSFQNLWITVCDMRAAINDLKNCCGASDCSQFILNFNVGTNNDRSVVTLFFSGLTTIPSGYANCTAQGSKVTISDSAGKQYIGYVDLIAAQTDVDGVPFTITGANLNTSLNYTVVVEGCVVKNGQTCSKTITKTSQVACATILVQSATLV